LEWECDVLLSIDFTADPLYSLHRSNDLSVRLTQHCGGALMGNQNGNKEREGFADAINRAAFGNERVLLRRRGRAVAAVIPIEDLRLLEALEDRVDLVDARAALAQANKKGSQSFDAMLKDLGL
jgi:antitoxin (DNA-binding transcriptional repressor) of toxin-antitoxin stability system